MFSAMVGWGFGATASRAAVVRTADGGLTWNDVSPSLELRDPFTVLHSIDPQHAWLGVPGSIGGQRAMTVYRTADAGKSWAAGESIVLPNTYPNAQPLIPGVQFVDVQHGWLTLVFQANDPTSTGVGVYATSDGGARWRLISLTIDQGGASTATGLPLGCEKTGIVFNNPSTGWAAAHCADGSLFLYATHDGGQSWHPQSLPAPAGYPSTLFGNCNCVGLPPLFATPNDGVLAFHSPDLLYLTHDAGETWQPVPLPSKYVGQSEFIDASHGWLNAGVADPVTHAIQPDRLYFTSDGGMSWQAVIPNHRLIGDLQFMADGTGWLIDRHASGPPQLYKTTDRGETWVHIQPRLVGLPSESA